MQVLIYEIEDHDIMDLYFDKDQPERYLADLGEVHGKLIFKGSMGEVPNVEDLLTLDGDDKPLEYIIIMRIYNADHNTATLFVHERHVESTVKS